MTDEEADPAQAAPFARDFGYLDKFLLAVNEHASSVEGARGARLRELLAGEVERFSEVRRLLAGGEPDAAASRADGADRGDADANRGDADATDRSRPAPGDRPGSAGPAPGRELTVGSLLGDRRRSERP